MQSIEKHLTETHSIHGLRTIFSVSVVIYHALTFAAFTLDDPSTVATLTTGTIPAHILSFASTLGNSAVDVFLFLSGFWLRASIQRVTAYSAARYIIFRYLRLAPAYLTIAYALRYQGNPNCIKPTEFLLLNFASINQRCIIPGWSTSADFLSHIILLPILQYPIILGSILILTPPLRAWTWIQRGKPLFPTPVTLVDFSSSEDEISSISQHIGIPRGNFTMSDPVLIARREMLSAYAPLYFGVQYRIAAVVVGSLLYTSMREKNAVYRTTRRFPTAFTLCGTAVWVFYHLVEQHLFTHPWAMFFHQAANRVLVAMATSVIIILSCSVEDHPSQHPISHFLRTFLSCRVFQFLHKFSYVVYLLHGPSAFVLANIPPKLTSDGVTPLWVLVMGIKWYLCTIIIGLPVWAVEWVALRARRWIRKNLLPSENDSDVTKKNA